MTIDERANAPDGDATSLWFRTHHRLTEMAATLGGEEELHDAENRWEWVYVALDGVRLNISRDHTKRWTSADVTIAMAGHDLPVGFPEPLLHRLVTALNDAGIRPVYLGWNVYEGGNDFRKVVQKRFD
ncbi:hypothetical protein AB0M36_16380 [Actinoplanes sp. NPDC051346]|uniref:hypothetical protein n=1 Tax=Actinoplanes sp. NPDC051346 TaxID=3155048 RepID=UPI003415EF7F